jgi:hypothetical protein
MRKNIWLILVVLLLAASILPIARAALDSSVYMPLVFKYPTFTPTVTPTVTLTPTVTPTQIPISIEITDVIDPGTTNEYIVIQNKGTRPVGLEDWKLTSLMNENMPPYFFPNFTLEAGRTVQVVTRSGTNSATVLYMGRDEPNWLEDGDCAILRDDSSPSIKMDEFCY